MKYIPMKVAGSIIDKGTGDGIPDATVQIFDDSGNYTGAGVTADSSGNFILNTPLWIPGNWIVVSSVGYKSATQMIDDDFFIWWNHQVLLIRDTKVLPDVTVASGSKKNYAWLLLLGAAVAVDQSTKKKKVSAVGAIDTGTVVAAGVALAMFKGFSLLNDLLSALGLTKDKDDTDFEHESQNPGSPFNLPYWQSIDYPTRVFVYGQVKPLYEQYKQELLDSFGYWNDDEAQAIGVFKHFTTKYQVACFCYIWQEEDGYAPMLEWLKGGGFWDWPADRLDTGEINEIIKYVDNLPKKQL